MKEFFYMGGYGFYVWTSYAVAAVILIANILIPKYQHKAILKTIAKKIQRAEQLK
jgi:heme exporter protein D